MKKIGLISWCWVSGVKMGHIVIHARKHCKFLAFYLFLSVNEGLSLCLSKEQTSSGCDRNTVSREEWNSDQLDFKRCMGWRKCEKKRATLNTGIKEKSYQDLPKAFFLPQNTLVRMWNNIFCSYFLCNVSACRDWKVLQSRICTSEYYINMH